MKTIVINDHVVVLRHIQTFKWWPAVEATTERGEHSIAGRRARPAMVAITTSQMCFNVECESDDAAKKYFHKLRKEIERCS